MIVNPGIFNRTLLMVFLFGFLVSCASMGAGKWSAYSMVVEINDEKGMPLADAQVSSIDNDAKTNASGRATLYYRTKGLYVITIQAPSMETTQIKVTIPSDIDKIVSVQLSPIQIPTP